MAGSKTARALAENVRLLKDAAGLSEKQLEKRTAAVGMKVSSSAIGYVLNYRDENDRHATLNTIEGLARVFNVDPAQLLIPGFAQQRNPSSAAPNLLAFEPRRTKKDQAHAKATPATLDTDLLETLIEGAQTLKRRTAKQKAELIASVYTKIQMGDESRSRENIVKLLRSA